MDSWHYNYYQNKSTISEFVKLLNEDRYIEICMDDGILIVIDDNSTVQINDRAMMVSVEEKVQLINTDKIAYVTLYLSAET